MFVDTKDDGCHFEKMLKDAVIEDYDPMSSDIVPSCSACRDRTCTYHPSNHAVVSAYKNRCAPFDVAFISQGSAIPS